MATRGSARLRSRRGSQGGPHVGSPGRPGLRRGSHSGIPHRAFSNRCGGPETALKDTRNAVGFLEFSGRAGLSKSKESVTLTVVEWLHSVRVSGESVPNASMRAIALPDEAIGLLWGLEHPAAKVAKQDDRNCVARRARLRYRTNL